MAFSEEQIKSLVRQVLLRTLGPDGIAPRQQTPAAPPAPRLIITEADVLQIPNGGELSIPAGGRVTPLAREAALERGVTLVSETSALPGARPGARPTSLQVVAMGADHGGLAMKEDLKSYVKELGFEVVDCGTHTPEAVDYPDLAYAVARMVADGQAWRGIIVDGAGIGSCMAANKVPGVRAALCYDHATAINSREHNDANVLTLGGALLGPSLARQIVQTWLETPFGGGRHARRVDKIMDIERRFLRT